MVQIALIRPTRRREPLPVVRSLTIADLKDVLSKGLEDFMAMPTHVIFLCAFYPIAGILLFRMTFAYDLLPLLYPLAAGFAIIGPLAAVGLYELSRRRESDLETSLRHVFDIIHSPSLGSILVLGTVLMFIFAVWISVANMIYVANFGDHHIPSVVDFVHTVLVSPQGHNLIIVGNLVGLLLAMAAACISVISFPLLLERDVGYRVAMMTSLRVVAKNPVTMGVWFLIVAVALAIGTLPLFMGLAVVLPILGHATWHLYRRAVEPAPSSAACVTATPY